MSASSPNVLAVALEHDIFVTWPDTLITTAADREAVAADRPRDRIRRGGRRRDGDRPSPPGSSSDPSGRGGLSHWAPPRRVDPASRARRRLLRVSAAHPL